jgi:hypothetical protein
MAIAVPDSMAWPDASQPTQKLLASSSQARFAGATIERQMAQTCAVIAQRERFRSHA